MRLGSLDGINDDEHNGIGAVEISKIFPMQNVFFGGEAFDGVYKTINSVKNRRLYISRVSSVWG